MRAAWIAAEILERFPNDIRSFNLVPGGHGQLDLFFNDELIIGHMTPEAGFGLGADDANRFLDARIVTAKIRDWRATVGRPVEKAIGGRVDVTDEDLGLNPNDPQLQSKLPPDHTPSSRRG